MNRMVTAGQTMVEVRKDTEAIPMFGKRLQQRWQIVVRPGSFRKEFVWEETKRVTHTHEPLDRPALATRLVPGSSHSRVEERTE